MLDGADAVAERLRQGFSGLGVLVVGDLMLDRHLWGEVERISPEAPVPVVRMTRETTGCGGAANVALNLAGLGASCILSGFIGQDGDGEQLSRHLTEAGVNPRGVVSLPQWPTITKTRIIGGHQQMLRLDREEPLPQGLTAARRSLLAALQAIIQERPLAIILSDYGKGVLDADTCREIIHWAAPARIPVLVDPKGLDFTKYQGASAIFPNRRELAAAVRLPAQDLDALLAAGGRLLKGLDIDFLAVTLSELGIALVEEGRVRRIPATAREVFDVSGAGDTVIAVLAACLAAGLPREESLTLANLAAGVVVGKVGTIPIGQEELLSAFCAREAVGRSQKMVALAEAARRVASWRQRGERVVFTNGCFDLLHAGHVTYLERAAQLGQRLVVGLNTDDSVRALKGPSRPIINERDRGRVLSALASVDLVIPFAEATPLRLIETLRPDILAKGADYTEDQVVGGDLVKSWGGRVALVDLLDGRSTSEILRAIGGKRD